MRKLLIILLLLPASLFAQQDPLYNQYIFNQHMINPAYTGIHNMLNASVISRKQWLGFEGSPFTNTLSIHTSLVSNKVGLGLLVINDRLGVNNNTEIHLTYSYKIDLGGSRRLSFGLQSGLINYRYDYSDLTFEFVDDPNFLPINENFTEPNFGAGVMFMSDYYFAGISVPRILNIEVNDGVISSTRYKKHYYLSGGALITLNQTLKLKPSVLVKLVEDNPLSVDLNGSLLIREFIWAGVSLRNFNTAGINGQIELNDQLRFAYTFEFPTNQLTVSNFGTHEVMLSFDIAPFNRQLIRRRYF